MKIGNALRSIFNTAAQSRPGQAFIAHAGKIACVSFFGADLVLGLKDYASGLDVTPNRFEQASAAAFFMTDLMFAASDRYPQIKPYIGWMIMAAGGLLGYAGMDTPGQNSQIFASSVIGLQGLSFVFEESLQKIARHQDNTQSGSLKTIFKPLVKYPVVSTAVIDVIGKISLAAAAIQKNDPGLFAVSAICILGDVGVMATDNNIKKILQKPAV